MNNDILHCEEINMLYDFYGCLLTTKQQDIITLYYQEDLSLAEIGENLGISRAAVNDHLKRTIKIMQDYEKKLQLVQKYDKRMQIYDKIKAVSQKQTNELVLELERLENE